MRVERDFVFMVSDHFLVGFGGQTNTLVLLVALDNY